jgi:hypothetical protein
MSWVGVTVNLFDLLDFEKEKYNPTSIELLNDTARIIIIHRQDQTMLEVKILFLFPCISRMLSANYTYKKKEWTSNSMCNTTY